MTVEEPMAVCIAVPCTLPAERWAAHPGKQLAALAVQTDGRQKAVLDKEAARSGQGT